MQQQGDQRQPEEENGEECDLGTRNGQPDSGCSSDCLKVGCGNGILEAEEECDSVENCDELCNCFNPKVTEFYGGGLIESVEPYVPAGNFENRCVHKGLTKYYYDPNKAGGLIMQEGYSENGKAKGVWKYYYLNNKIACRDTDNNNAIVSCSQPVV